MLTVLNYCYDSNSFLSLLFSQIAHLQASYERSVAEQEELTHNIGQTQARLERAAKLTLGLADEQVRWNESVKVNLVYKNTLS